VSIAPLPALNEAEKLSLRGRLFAKTVGADDGCLLWTGSSTRCGYGHISVRGRLFVVHRVAYELARGAVPEGLQLDHLCRNRGCCNVDHLEPVTQRVNILRGEAAQSPRKMRPRRLRSHCAKGHEYTTENTYIANGVRYCRICKKTFTARSDAKRRGSR
jgi:hypothetical protein